MFSWLSMRTGRRDFFSKIFDMSNIVGRPIRGPFVRPDKLF